MRILPNNTTVYTWIGGKLLQGHTEYIPTKGYRLFNGTGDFAYGVERNSFFLTKEDAIEAEMKKTFDRLIYLETLKREIAV